MSKLGETSRSVPFNSNVNDHEEFDTAELSNRRANRLNRRGESLMPRAISDDQRTEEATETVAVLIPALNEERT